MYYLYEICFDYIKYVLVFFKNIVFILVFVYVNISKKINYKIIIYFFLARLFLAL